MKSRRNRNRGEEDNGFAEWGGYMAAKIAKLAEQYTKDTCNLTEKQSDIFKGVAIFVNGYTKPTAEELKPLMAAHGGVYHHYQMSGGTTHIIASNLPNVKAKQLGNVPIVKANWITDSIAAEKLLDYRKYLLYTNQNRKQPILDFPVIPKPAPSIQVEVSDGKVPLNSTESAQNNTEMHLNDAQQPAIMESEVHSNTTIFQSNSNNSYTKPQGSRTLTAADPRFLAEFYSNSRLHLISTLGAEYKQLVSQLREKSNGKFPGKEKLKALECMEFISNERVVMHIDMDCFFVSVGVRNKPELQGKPVAVTHARSSQGPINRPENSVDAEYSAWKKYFPEDQLEKVDPSGSMAEIASCSYEARRCGVRNGMFLGTALKLCPNLQTIPYDFQGYRDVSTTLYNTIAAYTLDIEAVSCDEMYVDVAPILREAAITVEQWATHIRKEIMTATGCPCSTGFGANRLQARLATKKAKPAGQFHLKPLEVEEYMADLLLSDLPGVGHATVSKLTKMGLKTCGDVQGASLAELQAEIGQKVGETIYQQARGIDRKPLNFQHERKSVSADVNYGIRFKDKTEALNFLQSLSTEVCTRLQDIGMRARCLTLKLLIRAPEAPVETPKFLGCGHCNAINRSTTTGSWMFDSATIYKEAKALFEKINPSPVELRGVGIQLTRLEKVPPVNTALSRFLQQCPDKSEVRPSTMTEKVVENVEPGNDNKNATNAISTNSKAVAATNPPQNVPTGRAVEASKKPTGTATKAKSTAAKATSTSKRGRPKGKGNSNSKTSKKVVNNLNKYFKPPQAFSTIEPASSSDIDLNVLNELPEDLRKELIREYGLEDKVASKAGVGGPSTAVINEPKQPEAPTETPRKTSAFDTLDWEQFKPIILNWLNSESEPADVDITMLAEHFKQLAIDRKIEALSKMLSFLYRHVTKLGRCPWHEAYLTIVNTMQEGMVARYGSTLLVDRQFLCGQHC